MFFAHHCGLVSSGSGTDVSLNLPAAFRRIAPLIKPVAYHDSYKVTFKNLRLGKLISGVPSVRKD